MESAFSLERFSTIAAELDYVLLLGQPLPEFLCTAWHISSQPAPSVPLVLGQRCRGGLGVAAASGEARSTQGLLEVWQSSQGLGRLEEVGRVVVVQSLHD